MKRENEALERYKSLHENRVRLAQEEINKLNEAAAAKDDFRHNYHVIRDMKARKEAQHAKLMEAARNDALATVIKAIYITAMEAEAMMDENIVLAESMVDRWIDEQGGASKILSRNSNSTYLLSRISQIVEDAAIEAVNEIEKDEKEEEVPDEDASKAVQIAQLTAKDAEIKAQIAGLKAEKKAEDEEAAEAENTAKEEESTDDSEAVADTDDKADGVESTEDSDGKEETEPDTDDGDDSNNNDPEEIEDMDASEDKAEEAKTDEEAPADAAADEADGDTTVDAPAEEESTDKEEEESDDTTEDKTEDSESEDSASEEDDVDADAEIELSDEEETDPELKKDEEELTDDEVDPNEDASEDDDVKDIVGDPIDPEAEEDEEDVDDKGEIFEELEDEEDVQKAIEIIRNRVADAEETFIKNNAEDKKKIDELLNKISNNVKTVEDLGDKDPKKAQVAQEAVRECKQKIDAIYHDQTTTIFEKMSRILTQNIVKNDVVRESYTTEDGQLDTDLAMESAKVMYGFLETLNTLQIEKVDEKYIANVLNGMVE